MARKDLASEEEQTPISKEEFFTEENIKALQAAAERYRLDPRLIAAFILEEQEYLERKVTALLLLRPFSLRTELNTAIEPKTIDTRE